ncbi:helix-turn-helix transcriptional regulator [Nakamurella leprariae]|uniref:WYL domain-containing protein n=1 Tax=Nakamurella leprariae TaxID=2803911 RepID=A0A938Y6V5_9ACTN|nr:WYL domain-containing protein [Nakamurella leprariae]MBM9466890.1 WYL domain-containing protein [Nakamurella leprariae]
MLSSTTRLLQLLSLLQERAVWSGADLADRMAVDARTVRRDMNRLRELGYPVRSTKGTGGGYRFGPGGRLPPLLLDDDEALAVVVGLRTAMAGPVTGAEGAAGRALAKLERVLPPTTRDRAMAAGQHVLALPVSDGTAVTTQLVGQVSQACQSRVRLRFDYLRADGQSARRDVEPYRMVYSGRRWYLVAFDRDRSEWRTFRADRMYRVDTSTFTFPPRPLPEDPAVMVARAVSTSPYRHQARVRMLAPLEEVAPHVSVSGGVLEPDGPDACILTVGSDWLVGLAVHLAGTGFDFRVQEPVALIELVAELGVRLARAASDAPSPATDPAD